MICDAPKSATVQFALDENSLFRADDPKDFAAKIDYWIEHPKEKMGLDAGKMIMARINGEEVAPILYDLKRVDIESISPPIKLFSCLAQAGPRYGDRLFCCFWSILFSIIYRFTPRYVLYLYGKRFIIFL